MISNEYFKLKCRNVVPQSGLHPPLNHRTMSTFATQLKNEIGRLAKKEVRAETASIKKANSQYRADIAALKRRLTQLESLIKKSLTQSPMPQKVRSESNENLRFRVDGFATLRKKLGLTANEMGALIGVSGQSIYKWEQGKAKPRASQLQAIAAARKMGKRDVAAKLAGSSTEQA